MDINNIINATIETLLMTLSAISISYLIGLPLGVI